MKSVSLLSWSSVGGTAAASAKMLREPRALDETRDGEGLTQTPANGWKEGGGGRGRSPGRAPRLWVLYDSSPPLHVTSGL